MPVSFFKRNNPHPIRNRINIMLLFERINIRYAISKIISRAVILDGEVNSSTILGLYSVLYCLNKSSFS